MIFRCLRFFGKHYSSFGGAEVSTFSGLSNRIQYGTSSLYLLCILAYKYLISPPIVILYFILHVDANHFLRSFISSPRGDRFVPPLGSFRPSVGISKSLPWDFFVPTRVGDFRPISMGRAFRTIYHIMHVSQSTRATRCMDAEQDDSYWDERLALTQRMQGLRSVMNLCDSLLFPYLCDT